MMALVARWFDPARRGRAAGFVTIGSGFAIIASGKLIPYVNRLVGADGWRTNWMILGLCVTAVAAVALVFLRTPPASAPMAPAPHASTPRNVPTRPAQRGVVPVLGILYAIFGYTYAIYVTFMVTMFVREKGLSEAVAGQFWSWVGLLSLLSGPVFGTLSDRLGRRRGLATVFAVQTLAYAMAAASLPPVFLYLSVAFFGIAAWSIPTIMVAAVSDHVGGERALGWLGAITFFFGIGQVAGPAVAGVLAERTGSFSSSFYMAAALTSVAILLSGLLEGPRQAARESGMPATSSSPER
jgi:MFS family permease